MLKSHHKPFFCQMIASSVIHLLTKKSQNINNVIFIHTFISTFINNKLNKNACKCSENKLTKPKLVLVLRRISVNLKLNLNSCFTREVELAWNLIITYKIV